MTAYARDACSEHGANTPVAVDLRSDTVTCPTEGMRAAMRDARVGDDVYGEDPSVIALEARVAALTGKPAALFLPSATQANLCAILSHCQRGEEYMGGAQYHTFRYEAGGASAFGGVIACPLETEPDGALDPARVAAAIKPDDPHFPASRLLCLENTVYGAALETRQLSAAADAARHAGLRVHLDGARLFNASVATGASPAEIAEVADSVTICLSKGLGAPVGAVLCGSAAFAKTARRQRKALGGDMRQSGVLGAAALYALDHHRDRLADDHARAEKLASALEASPHLTVEPRGRRTNMVFVRTAPDHFVNLKSHLRDQGVVVGGEAPVLRLVMHLDIDDSGLAHAIEAFRSFSC